MIVLSNLAGVAVQFFYQFLGTAFDSPMISALWENKLVNVVTCLAFLAVAHAGLPRHHHDREDPDCPRPVPTRGAARSGGRWRSPGR